MAAVLVIVTVTVNKCQCQINCHCPVSEFNDQSIWFWCSLFMNIFMEIFEKYELRVNN